MAYSLFLWRVPFPTSFSVGTRPLGFLCHHITFPSCPQIPRKEVRLLLPDLREKLKLLISSWLPPTGCPTGNCFIYFPTKSPCKDPQIFFGALLSPHGSLVPILVEAVPCLWLTYFWNPQGSEVEDCLCFWDTVLSGRQDSVERRLGKESCFCGHDYVASF